MVSAAQPAPDYRHLFESSIAWTATGDLDMPWRAEFNRQRLTIRMNEFPEEQLYLLLVGDALAASFNDWPAAWSRG